MKKYLLLILTVFFISANSQIKALTEDGKEIILFDNKTWKFVNESDEKTLAEMKKFSKNQKMLLF